MLRAFLDKRGGVAIAQERLSETAQAQAQGRGQGQAATDLAAATPSEENSGDGTSPGDGPLRTVAVSLSGGVDSMALCAALVHLKPVYGFEVMGIHIDYGNRHESGREADFVEGWCARHGVIFYKRAIAEVRVTGLGGRSCHRCCRCCCCSHGWCTRRILGVMLQYRLNLCFPAVPCRGEVNRRVIRKRWNMYCAAVGIEGGGGG